MRWTGSILAGLLLIVSSKGSLSAAHGVPVLDQWSLGPEFRFHQVPIDGGQLGYARRPGIGATVVLIPGTYSDSRIYTEIARTLDRSFNLILLETRGIGHSWPPPNPESIEILARDAFVVLDHLKVETFFIGGHSLGGMISLEMGRQQPSRIVGIISLEGWTNASAQDAFPGDKRSTLTAEQVAFLAQYKKETTAKWTPQQVTEFGKIWRRWDGTSFIESTDLPILELYGDRGKPRPAREKLGIPPRKNIELVWLEGASHSIWLERPQLVASNINRFVLATVGDSLAAQQAAATLPQEYEVVVIGGTPGGIATAVTAARLGRSVILVEHQKHLGGMSTSGLGVSDIRRKQVIQGFFREFISRVVADYTTRYGRDSETFNATEEGYRYEAHVAERIFESLIQEQKSLTALKFHQFVSATVVDNRVVAVTVQDRKTGSPIQIKGKVFVDATYEGDLYASAGAEFRVGRESRAEYGEPHAGHIYCDVKTKQIIGGTGAGDDRITAYTYRMNITTNKANQVPFGAPPLDYDRTRYLGYLDDARSDRFSDKPYLALVTCTITSIPNRKFDVNLKPTPLGYVFAEENKGYPTADWTKRELIAERIRNLALGLWWFLQNDEAVSPESREYALRYGLCRDEFADNDHFPYQLYVREARRLVGEFTLTEKNLTEQPGIVSERQHRDAIAVGEFPIDSMPVRKRQPGDTVVLEGYLGMLSQITRPYQIPYRIMIPIKIDGLIVPVAASTSHVGFSSIRLEPTWMVLGQAAGIAAHLSIKHEVPPRKVPYPELREILKAQNAVLDLPAEANSKQ